MTKMNRIDCLSDSDSIDVKQMGLALMKNHLSNYFRDCRSFHDLSSYIVFNTSLCSIKLTFVCGCVLPYYVEFIWYYLALCGTFLSYMGSCS